MLRKTNRDSEAQLAEISKRQKTLLASPPSDKIEPLVESVAQDIYRFTHMMSGTLEEVYTISPAAAQFLRSPECQKRGNDRPFVLSGLQVTDEDLSNLDFSQAQLHDTVFGHCDVTGCDFKGVAIFDTSDWNRTAWWRAKSISPLLLKYLEDNYPYDEKQKYPYDPSASREEYNKGLILLSIH
jgi:hypothetical protein